MKPIILLLLAVTGVVIFILFLDRRKQKIDRIALEELNLKLTGVVTHVSNMNNGDSLGIITTHIINTNIPDYDPRDSVEFYYCVIKDSIAEIYDNAYKSMLGDTIMIDTKRKLQSWGTEQNKKIASKIEINTNKNYYDYIRRTTAFKRS